MVGIEDRDLMAAPRMRELDVALLDPSYTGRAGLRQFRQSFRSEAFLRFFWSEQLAERRTFGRRRRGGTGRLLVLSRVGYRFHGSSLMCGWRC